MNDTHGYHAYAAWWRARCAAAGTIHIDKWKLLDRGERECWESAARAAQNCAPSKEEP